MTSTQRPRRVQPLDRPWLGQRSVLLATPVRTDVAAIRAALLRFAHLHPDSPIASRLDAATGRWLPVPPHQRAAHVERLVTTAPDPDPDDLEAHVRRYRVTAPDLPVVVVVSPTAVLTEISHAVGDAATFTRLTMAISRASGLDELAHRTGTRTVLRALRSGLRAHRQDWADFVRHRVAPPRTTTSGPPQQCRPDFTGTVVPAAALREITRWRNAHARGTSITSVLTTMTHRAFTDLGVPVRDDGLWALIDIRGLLPDAPHRWGNLSKSLYLTAALRDPAAVEAAMKQARDTSRALPALVLGSLTGAVATPQQPPTRAPRPDAVTLTFNSMPTLPGLADMDWVEGAGPRRFFGFGPSMGPEGLTVFAIRTREHLELSASYDSSVISTDTAAKALAALTDPAALLAAMG
ncbi:hypothetical protein [Actinokineospora bangkokensis]|uniref:Diacylglycerol O-acyltransferase n=1 Tax=Actinokineospora bangkokensis TaxID=1193682 RepID=A0A1Q9LK64_9PSEU|nr:hypothetical protein [Actinokineospora bangkokensis]OLR92447.1 hypothetical protein BJP25_20420 [Actinokineospora bangkokensis]